MDSKKDVITFLTCRYMRLFAPLVVLLCLSQTYSFCSEQPRTTQPGDISCRLVLLAKDGTITAGEPVIARLEITNQAREEVQIWPGGTFLDVYNSQGKLLATMPRPHNVLDFLYSSRNLAPNETLTKYLIVTGLYQFKIPGLYSIQIQQLVPPQELSVLCEDAASLKVLPYNAPRLEAVCDELFTPLRKHTNFGDLSLVVRTKALYSMRADVALPYLDWMAREWGDRYACRAIRRIGTLSANNLLDSLTTKSDRVGKAARQALEMSLEPTSWDVEGE